MLKVGLTGNIGSGKSIVARIFSILGIPVYHADECAKILLETRSVTDRIVTLFGAGILAPDGTIDRRKLGSLVFSDPDQIKMLNELLHPLVMKDFIDWCRLKENHSYIIQEAAIIIESGYKDDFDKIIHVSCPRETCIERVVQRDKVVPRDVELRMQYQFEDSKKAAISDFVILNDGSEMIIPQVLSIHQKLMKNPS